MVAATTLDYAAHSRLWDFVGDVGGSGYVARKVLKTAAGGRVVEAPNGVDVERFHPGVEASGLRERYGLATTRPVILFVGGLDRAHYFKGVPVLLRALCIQREAHLIVVGDGELRPAYEQQAAKAGLRCRVHFAGRVSEEELPRYYALADVVALPSTTRGEAFGLVLLEAMASGKPVVASRLPGVRIVVNDGVTGLLAAPGDAADLAEKLNAVLTDGEMRSRMGSAGRRAAEERFTWRQASLRLGELYGEAACAAGARAPAIALPGGGR